MDKKERQEGEKRKKEKIMSLACETSHISYPQTHTHYINHSCTSYGQVTKEDNAGRVKEMPGDVLVCEELRSVKWKAPRGNDDDSNVRVLALFWRRVRKDLLWNTWKYM